MKIIIVFFGLCCILTSSLYPCTDPISYEQKLYGEMGILFNNENAVQHIGLFQNSNFIYRISLTGPKESYESSDILFKLGMAPQAVIGNNIDDESSQAFTTIGDSDIHFYQFTEKNVWIDLTQYCAENNVYATLNEDWQTHISTEMVLWIGFSASLGDSLKYSIFTDDIAAVNVQGYEIIDAHDQSLPITYDTIVRSNLTMLLQDQDAFLYNQLFDQQYVYHITLDGPFQTEETSQIKFLFDQIPDAVIARVEQTSGNEYALIGTIPYDDSYIFQLQDTWVNVTTYCNAKDIYAYLFEDWVVHTSSKLDIWIGFNSTLGAQLDYQVLAAGEQTIEIQGYEIVPAIEKSISVDYDIITRKDLEQILQNQNAGDFNALFNQDFVYHITMHGPITTGSGTVTYLLFDQITPAIIGQINKTEEYENAIIGTNLETDRYVFQENNIWVDITNFCNATVIKTNLIEDYILHTPVTLQLWVGFNTSLGAEFNYKELLLGEAEITVQGYQIASPEENEIAINYDNVTKEQLDGLLDADGASAFNALFDQPYVYRFVLSSHSGESQNFTKIISHLESIPDAAIGYAYMNEESPNAMIGIDQASAHTISESWEDLTAHAGTADLYMELDIGLFTHHASTVYLWMGFSNSIGNTLLYDLFDEFSAPPAHFTIDGYNIQTEILSETVDFGYLPITKTERDCMLVLDGAEDFSDILIAPYIFNMYLKSDSDIVTAVKMQLNLEQAPVQAIGLGSGENNPQAAIGDAINNQHNVDTENWEDISDFANTREMFIILNDDPQTLVPGELSLWIGFNTPPGHSLSYENLSGFLKPDSFSLKPYRIINDQKIEQVEINTPAEYKLKYLQEGDNYYLDRNYYLKDIPDDLENLVWLVPNNKDKNNTDTDFITLDLDNPGTVYIAYDRRAETPPNWLTENYSSSAFQIQVSDFSTPMNVWQKEVPAGELVLGGNMAVGAEGVESQYIVILDIPTGIPPVADFNMSTDMGDAALVVSFQDQSTGYITSWNWDFGDGESSTEQNPSHTFQYADTFKVTLTVSSSDGTDSKSDTVIVTEAVLIAKFGADVTEGPVPLTVQFSDSSSGNIESWLWEFGDGETSSEQNPSHQYTSADTFTVTLTISGPGGTAKLSKTDFIKVAFPTGIANINAAPDRFELYSNYPNPFNPQTQITFDVPRAQHINIAIFNINGSLVEMLVDEQKSQGRYTVTWNSMQHSTGTYFIRMRTPEYNRIIKCILLK